MSCARNAHATMHMRRHCTVTVATATRIALEPCRALPACPDCVQRSSASGVGRVCMPVRRNGACSQSSLVQVDGAEQPWKFWSPSGSRRTSYGVALSQARSVLGCWVLRARTVPSRPRIESELSGLKGMVQYGSGRLDGWMDAIQCTPLRSRLTASLRTKEEDRGAGKKGGGQKAGWALYTYRIRILLCCGVSVAA